MSKHLGLPRAESAKRRFHRTAGPQQSLNDLLVDDGTPRRHLADRVQQFARLGQVTRCKDQAMQSNPTDRRWVDQ